MEEMWLPIKNFEFLYEVSDKGRVRSLTRKVDFGSQKRISKGRILKPNNNGSGYFYVNLSNGKIRTREYIHRLVANAFIENEHEKPEVNHKDGNKSNNNSNNLEWVTGSENRDHAYLNDFKKGLPSEATIIDVNMMVDLIKTGKYTSSEIQRVFKISSSFYYKVVKHDAELNEILEKNKLNRLGGSGRGILVFDKEKKTESYFKSASKAAKHFGFYNGYFSEVATKLGGENGKFKVKYVSKRGVEDG